MAAPVKLSRFKGSMVGGVVGDCIGAVFEGMWGLVIGIERVLKEIHVIDTVAEKQKSDQGGSACKKNKMIWDFTDDTAMARSVAKSLIANNGLVVKDIAKRFSDEFMEEPGRGYGSGVVSVFRQLSQSGCADVFGPARKQFEGQGSYGNGGSMRIAPAGLYAHTKQLNFDQLQDLVTKITLVTHSHNGAILGSVLQSYAVYLALQTDKVDVDSFIDSLRDKMVPLEQKMKSDTTQKADKDGDTGSQEKMDTEESKTETYAAKLEKIREFAKQDKQPTNAEVDKVLGTDISALRSAPTALYCFLRGLKDIDGIDKSHNAFERTIIYAISLGGDTDTIATMAGAIAGAYYGIEAIPAAWQQCCEGVDDALKDAESLCKLT